MDNDILIERLKAQNGELLFRIAELEANLKSEKKNTADLTEYIRKELTEK